MELKLSLYIKHGYSEFIRTEFTEDDLFKVMKQWVEDNYNDTELLSVDIESIIP